MQSNSRFHRCHKLLKTACKSWSLSGNARSHFLNSYGLQLYISHGDMCLGCAVNKSKITLEL